MQILISLFVAAFLSATLLPGSSEVVLAGILATGEASVAIAVTVATIGNTLGACVNWFIGRFFARFRHHRYFPVAADKYDAYAKWYQKWGVWSLLASWVPIIGDPLTVLAGVARTPFVLFVVVVFFAKAVRYLVVAGVISLIW